MKNFADSFDDIVFEFRNKTYGAYDLRKRYPKRGAAALLISLTILGTAVGVPLVDSFMSRQNWDNYIGTDVVATISDMDIPKDEQMVPPTPPPPPPSVQAVKFEAIEIVDSITEPDIQIATVDQWKEIANTTPADTSEVIVLVNEPQIVEMPVESFDLDEQPLFPGGELGLKKFIAENIKYPTEAMEINIQGGVYIRFVVTATGEIGEAKILRGVHDLLDEEALRIVKSLPKWTPGKKNGKPKSTWFIVPIKFVLQ
ncbi:MAG TPA: hypothetical protein DCQ31_14785 [Bacteroidales bacterium]|nr:hypothetical protein [Bacteroidales bacterium]